MGESTLIASTAKLTRQQLAAVPTADAICVKEVAS
jgi:hypothetical protein